MPRKHLALQAFVRLYAQIPSDFLNALRLNERSPTERTARAVNVIQSHFTERSCSWNIFAYDLLPNQLRPTDLLLGQVSNGGGLGCVFPSPCGDVVLKSNEKALDEFIGTGFRPLAGMWF